jgi:tRNA(Arg) A34 adenosine deaminase TadA
MSKEIEKNIKIAIDLAKINIEKDGGPFGAVITRNGEIIAKSANSVTNDNDPTAHAEINAIRKAAKKLGTFDLSGCEIYSSCEPCPMCLGAIYWAKIDKLYFAATKVDAQNAGFSDKFIYDEIELQIDKRKLQTINILREDAQKVFELWTNKEDKTTY